MTRQQRRALARKGVEMRTLLLRGDGPKTKLVLAGVGQVEAPLPGWRGWLLAILASAPVGPQGQSQGFNKELMGRRLRCLRVLRRLPEDATEVQFEDADMKEVAAAVTGFAFPFADDWAEDFITAVQAAGSDDKDWRVKMRAAAEWPRPTTPEDVVAEAEAAAQEA